MFSRINSTIQTLLPLIIKKKDSINMVNRKSEIDVFDLNKAYFTTNKKIDKKMKLKAQKKSLKEQKRKFFFGEIISIKDNIFLVTGLQGCFIGELVFVYAKNTNKIEGLVLNIENHYVKIALLTGDQTVLNCGDIVYRTGNLLKVKSGFGVLGNVLSPIGITLNKKDFSSVEKKKRFYLEHLSRTEYVSIDIVAPGIVERMSVKKPFLTGVTLVDCFIPIGCGQRELIIGDNNTGKTSLAITALLNQRNLNNLSFWRKIDSTFSSEYKLFLNPCVFVSIGKKRSELARLKKVLETSGALHYTVFLYTSSDDSAALQYLAPYSGCAVAEWFMNKGYDSLIVYDDLSEHAVAYRQMSLLLRRPPGREAYPGDVFYLHSRLLERACQLSMANGGGSLTALPIVETKGGDLSGYIPTNVISITDGQLFLSKAVANKGLRPAIDWKPSVSRVGSSAQCDVMFSIYKRINKVLSLYQEHAEDDQLGGSSSKYIAKIVDRGHKLYRFMSQPLYKTVTLSEQVICMFCISEGYTDSIKLDYIDLYFKMIFNSYFLNFYLKDKSFFFNKDLLNTIFTVYGLDVLKDDLSILCEEYSIFFRYTVQPLLDSGDKTYYSDLKYILDLDY